jgi:predicted nucleic acid-binding protein
MIVIDSSVLLELLLATPRSAPVRQKIADWGDCLHAPHLIDLETAQGLRKWVQIGEIVASRADEALIDLTTINISRYPHDGLLRRIWALRHNMTPYDAAYVALAEELNAPLLTLDQKLAKAAAIEGSVELI